MFGFIKDLAGTNVESIESQYIYISNYRPLLGSSYTSLPVELKSLRKGLINIKNTDQKIFLWSHFRHINPSKEHPERIKKTGKKIAEKPDHEELSFPSKKKILARLR